MLPWNDAKAGSDDISQLVHLSNLIGQDLALVQPGGGNTSVKLETDDVFGCRVQALAVKGSGTDLRTIGPGGFTYLYLDRLATLRDRDSMSDEEMMRLMRACMLRDGDPLPSVETPLHSLIPRETARWRKLYRGRAAVEREFGRLKNEWALLPLRVRGIERVRLHADLTILAALSCALARARAAPLAA